MDASQLIRIRMERAQQFKSRAQPAVDSSLLTYRTMIKAAAGVYPGYASAPPACSSEQAPAQPFVEQCPSDQACTVGVTARDGVVLARETRPLVAEGHLRLGSRGSGSQFVSADAVALRNAGAAECAGPAPQPYTLPLPTPGCGDCAAAVYYEPGRYDPVHPDERLITPAPCGIAAELRRVVAAPCANDSTPLYDAVNGQWTHQDGNHLVYPLPPSA